MPEVPSRGRCVLVVASSTLYERADLRSLRWLLRKPMRFCGIAGGEPTVVVIEIAKVFCR